MGKPMSKLEERAFRVVGPVFGGLHTWLYRVSDGNIGGRFAGGAPVLLLTTTGRRSGKPRTSPLLYVRDGEKLVVVASKGGAPTHPAWYLNLNANPEVEVQLGNERKKMRAETCTAEQKARYWQRLRAVYPGYQGYQDRTKRDIPVVILRPA
jgi:deazaflavin-dependent oxidoreductase (nitroreductase family)